MDSRGKSMGPSAMVESAKGPLKRMDEGEDSEKEYLLQPVPLIGAMASGKRKISGRRKVQWKDRNGKKLVEVLEFQPSPCRSKVKPHQIRAFDVAIRAGNKYDHSLASHGLTCSHLVRFSLFIQNMQKRMHLDPSVSS